MKMNFFKHDRIAARVLIVLLILIMGGAASGCSRGSHGGSDAADADTVSSIGEFTTTSLDGSEVTQAVFADADITMINFWGTYCGPCIAEMPELAKLAGEYKGHFQLIGVPIDVDFSKPESSEYLAALEILRTAEASFTNISPAGGIAEYMKSMQFVPTSIFVDSDGNIVGGPVIGANVKEYKKVIEEKLN